MSELAEEIKKNIEGTPSKELFISMLIKDITLRDAIGDLIDNSVDAANKNAINESSLSNFSISINIDKNQFEIHDNAGGIEEKVARESAFKLGKPKNFESGKHTIGQFGIGMKRAFFKIGEQIFVESKALTSSFTIKISVPAWRDQENEKDWNFDFDSVSVNENNPIKETFTRIVITNLKDEVKKQFGDAQFLNDLKKEIALEQQVAIRKGLKIRINKTELNAPEITLIYDKTIKPAYWSHAFKTGLKAEIVAGVSDDIGEDGGWYIFCNDRLILGPDTSEVTGWKGGRGKSGKEGKELPKFHDQYFRFRGYVYFNADNSSNLPWNTSKTGMDKDSNEFTYVRAQMIIMGKQVKALMDDMKKERERDNPVDQRHLNNLIETAKVVSVTEILKDKKDLPAVYQYPKNLMKIAPKKHTLDITFSKPQVEIEKAKIYFGVGDSNTAGSLAFDYFYDNEIGRK